MNQSFAVILLVCAMAYACLGIPYTPPYTFDLQENDKAVIELKKHLIQLDDYDSKDSELHYMMILNAVNQVMDFYALDPKPIGMDYYGIVSKAIKETLDNPHQAFDQVRAQLDRTSSKIAAITDLIRDKENNVCAEPVSRSCDMIINLALRTSQNTLLKKQASLLETLSKEVYLYLSKYAHEFQEAANARNAPAYLINGMDHLDPLLQAGAKVRQEAKDMPLLRRSLSDHIWA